MDIQELIEEIASSGKEYGMFHFTMEDADLSIRETRKCLSSSDTPRYHIGTSTEGKLVLTETKFMHKTDDAIAFLFDADIHLWQLMSWNIQYDDFSVLPPTWNITLRR